ncbi:DUF6119 family protein [Streptomyces sp. DSM 42041]|uniref:DUF6119 family protein n=1 Tax=Streptomyces hazeniae TaxID=3075538 RepID=A0ABU2NZL4_9ACTN|nr:DUF6119 family protein [Streptomyces sp. DSM 42041]MDT0382056.1 DUF6119 family protein [Streptomyces sp. DSM 42041]
MKLTVSIARKDVTTFEELIRAVYVERLGLTRLEPTSSLSFPVQAYIQRDKPTQPKWVNFLGQHFAVTGVENTSNSFVLLAKVRDRIFAVTFGVSGINSLDRGKLERGFGLRVCANSVDASELISVDTRNLDAVTRQQKTHLSIGSSISDFSIPVEQDWVRRIQGKTGKLDFAKSLSGADSLHINVSGSLSKLPDFLSAILDAYESEDYKTTFPFLDYYSPVDSHDPRFAELERKLLARVLNRATEKTSLAAPQIVDDEQVSHYEISAKYKVAETEEVTLAGVYEFLGASYDGDDPLHDVRIVPIADSGQAAGQKRPLRDWVVCEVAESDRTYVLSLGEWYEVAGDFVSSVNSEVARIADVTDELQLDAWQPSEKEGDYNERVAENRQWALLDKKNYSIGGPSQKIEICDLLTKDMQLICVKQQTSSATLSHLFSQGSVSAELYRGEPDYRNRIYNDARENWGEEIPEPPEGPTPTIVYAIANDRPGKLADNLFFFSKITLLANRRIIERLGIKVAMARVPMPTGTLRTKKRKRRSA